jgi:hypothetical protein
MFVLGAGALLYGFGTGDVSGRDDLVGEARKAK